MKKGWRMLLLSFITLIVISSLLITHHPSSESSSFVNYTKYPTTLSFQNSFACTYNEPSQTYLIQNASGLLCLYFYNNSTQSLYLSNLSLVIAGELVATNAIGFVFDANSSISPSITFNGTGSAQLGEQEYSVDSNSSMILVSGMINIVSTPPTTTVDTISTTATTSTGKTTTTIISSSSSSSSSSTSSTTHQSSANGGFSLDQTPLVPIVILASSAIVAAAVIGIFLKKRSKS